MNKKRSPPQSKNGIKQIVEDIENDLRDLINWIKLKNEEELEIGEGKKIEDDAAKELIEKVKAIAFKLGIGTL